MSLPSKIAKGVAPVVAKKAVELARDEQNRKLAMDLAKPVADGAMHAAAAVKGRARLPRRGALDKLDKALEPVEAAIEQRASAGSDPAKVDLWRRELAGMRAGASLARVDEGKGRKEKVRDLERRKQALLDDIYADTGVTSTTPAGGQA